MQGEPELQKSFLPRTGLSLLSKWLLVPAMGILLAWIGYPARQYFQGGAALGSQTSASSAVERGLQEELAGLKGRLAQNERANTELRSQLQGVTQKLETTRQQLVASLAEADRATARTDRTAQMVKNLDTSVHTELATKASTNEIKAVDYQVAKVSTNLDKTSSDLQMARSELGTLIAQNQDEIKLLRKQGGRDYTEFTITGTNQPQKVGNVTLVLKGVNEKRHRSNILYTVEDKTYEAKNTNTNSPLFFYLSGTNEPEEIVINKASKDTISGYLSVPKSITQAATAAAAAGDQ
jgi:hypothetical protein